MADKKNLCAQIDIALHNRVTEEKDRLEMTTSQYIAALLTEYYKMKDGHCKVNMKKLGPEISQYRYATSRNSRLRFLDSLSPAHCAGVRLFKAE